MGDDLLELTLSILVCIIPQEWSYITYSERYIIVCAIHSKLNHALIRPFYVCNVGFTVYNNNRNCAVCLRTWLCNSYTCIRWNAFVLLCPLYNTIFDLFSGKPGVFIHGHYMIRLREKNAYHCPIVKMPLKAYATRKKPGVYLKCYSCFIKFGLNCTHLY